MKVIKDHIVFNNDNGTTSFYKNFTYRIQPTDKVTLETWDGKALDANGNPAWKRA